MIDMTELHKEQKVDEVRHILWQNYSTHCIRICLYIIGLKGIVQHIGKYDYRLCCLEFLHLSLY